MVYSKWEIVEVGTIFVSATGFRKPTQTGLNLAILHQSKIDRLKTLRLEDKRIHSYLKNVELKFSSKIWVLKEFR